MVNQRQAHYSNLAPRPYRFRVMASNNSGVWNETGDTLEFSIAAAYYQTVWFRSGCAVAFLALLWALYRFRLHQIARLCRKPNARQFFILGRAPVDSSLSGGDAEYPLDEALLANDIAFRQPADLTFANHVHGLVSRDGT